MAANPIPMSPDRSPIGLATSAAGSYPRVGRTQFRRLRHCASLYVDVERQLRRSVLSALTVLVVAIMKLYNYCATKLC
jgi:hypothetical protein